MILNNLKDVADYFGANHPTVDSITRCLYMGTDCGARFDTCLDGFVIGSIVEGSDAEFSEGFEWGISSDVVDAYIKTLESQCSEAWNEANCEDEEEIVQ
jgi:hypothetical protein